ncbi:hypothetical protein GOP47_0008756 [Adiantum capillus-veneris]|uniref:Uncharacterized protein n=1 Tax=Adiantum capillus-veneris TaxID=13818 RepID=A0A9D4ZKP8_ADICA|nr:hypothetical protein GOP47_0008756 [Adiantum capillus-veneris]
MRRVSAIWGVSCMGERQLIKGGGEARPRSERVTTSDIASGQGKEGAGKLDQELKGKVVSCGVLEAGEHGGVAYGASTGGQRAVGWRGYRGRGALSSVVEGAGLE